MSKVVESEVIFAMVDIPETRSSTYSPGKEPLTEDLRVQNAPTGPGAGSDSARTSSGRWGSKGGEALGWGHMHGIVMAGWYRQPSSLIKMLVGTRDWHLGGFGFFILTYFNPEDINY